MCPTYTFSIFREKKKEKEREELWKRLTTLEQNPPDLAGPPPQILSKTPMTAFVPPREKTSLPATGSASGDKSPNANKKAAGGAAAATSSTTQNNDSAATTQQIAGSATNGAQPADSTATKK